MTERSTLKLINIQDVLDDEFCDCMHPEAVVQARQFLDDEDTILDAADMFSVLGDATRLRVLVSLLSGEMCVTDIAVATGVNRTTISHQLRVLRSNNLVNRRRDCKVVYYELANEQLAHMLELVAPGIGSTTLGEAQ